ncbi:MAG: hypothetical protein LV479_09150 [Methylacidiphilales bacterium]|nr:hypothetical protein [Candidatus Methylacidiphilales bacterium]
MPALLILLGMVFFGSLLRAAAFSPRSYDWRYNVISSLASPRDNPDAWHIGQGGLIVTGLLLVGLNPLLYRRFADANRGPLLPASFLFLAGAILLALTGWIVPGPHIWGGRHLHEHLAQFSAVCLGLATIFYLLCLLKEKLFRPGQPARIIAGTLVIVPLAVLLLSRLALVVVHVTASAADYEAMKKSLWCSLALWEWIGAVCLYAFFWMIALVHRE